MEPWGPDVARCFLNQLCLNNSEDHTRRLSVKEQLTSFDRLKSQPSVSEAFSELVRLQEGLDTLIRSASPGASESTKDLACEIRLYLQQARVLLLCINVDGAMLKMNTASQNLRKLQDLLAEIPK